MFIPLTARYLLPNGSSFLGNMMIFLTGCSSTSVPSLQKPPKDKMGRKPEYPEETPEAENPGENMQTPHTWRRQGSNPQPWRSSDADGKYSAVTGVRYRLLQACDLC
ncbi:hypothetical protein QTP86_025864 [Hemibagrus guttatus]|nr:hypothetical protein QTP86_025864 [Hemibagrus guttatus]